MSFQVFNTDLSELAGYQEPPEIPDPVAPPALSEVTTENMQAYLQEIQSVSNKDYDVTGYTNPFTNIPGGGYFGGVYVPVKNRVYLVPSNVTRQVFWHYIDCRTGAVVAYNNGLVTQTPIAGTPAVATGGIASFQLTLDTAVTLSAGTLIVVDNVVYEVRTNVTASVTVPLENSGGDILDPLVVYGNDANALDGVEVFTSTNPTVVTIGVYNGGCYCPELNRVYFTPNPAQGASSSLHYLDMNQDGGNVVSTYSNTFSIFALGCVYDPNNQRVYFIPSESYTTSDGYYLECSTNTLVSYVLPSSLDTSNAYYGGIYSETQKRIYFIPFLMAPKPIWHYIDVSTAAGGQIVSYNHGFGTTITNYYAGACLSPLNNRIYLIPGFINSINEDLIYIDCNTPRTTTPLVLSYSNPMGIARISEFMYCGGVYNPTLNRIYFVPGTQAYQTEWHYIDCDTETIVSYEHGQSITPILSTTPEYCGGVYSPLDNTIYFVPSESCLLGSWHIIVDYNSPVSRGLMAYTSFNKF